MTEVRPLRWHDLPFTYRLAGHGTSFDTQLITTVGDDILSHALLTGMGRTQLYVLRTPDQNGLGQLHYSAEQQTARVAYLAPALKEGGSEELWHSLLDGLVVMAGQRGVVKMVAEVAVDAPEVEVLRAAQFGMYGRQELFFRLPGPVDAHEAVLRPADAADVLEMQALYSVLIPGLMRQVEPLSLEFSDNAYVMNAPNGGLWGMSIGYRGSQNTLVEMYLTPEAYRLTGAFIQATLDTFEGSSRPIYCQLRYADRLAGALLENGFEHVETQAVMVRHLAVTAKRHSFRAPAVGLNGKKAPSVDFHFEGVDCNPELWTAGRSLVHRQERQQLTYMADSQSR